MTTVDSTKVVTSVRIKSNSTGDVCIIVDFVLQSTELDTAVVPSHLGYVLYPCTIVVIDRRLLSVTVIKRRSGLIVLVFL